MTHEDSVEHLAHELEHVFRIWELRGQKAGSPPSDSHSFTITLSREAGARGTLVAQEVGKTLNWPVYDHQLLERISQDMGIRTKLLETVDEKQIGWLRETIEAALSVPRVAVLAYVDHLVKTVLALGIHGECVIVGRGASFILPAATTLRVRLKAPLQDRIAAISKDLKMAREEAKRHVETFDREHRNFVQSYFLKDSADLHHYDLILNTSRFSIAGCAATIVESVRSLQR